MFLYPTEFLFALLAAVGVGFCAGVIWDHIWTKQPRDSRGRFKKRDLNHGSQEDRQTKFLQRRDS